MNDNVFIPMSDISVRDDMTCNKGICTFDTKSHNPEPCYPYLVRVGSGYRAFKNLPAARRYYNQPY